MDRLYTIGYSGFSIIDFISILKNYKIQVLVDVRSIPHSQYFEDYNEENLSYELRNAGIVYRNYKDNLGARPNNKKYYPKGFLDFELFSKSQEFLEGFEKVKGIIKKGYVVAIMCAEKDPLICHRTNLIAKAFYEANFEIIHIMPEGKTCSQQDIEKRLLDKFFPDRKQLNLFEQLTEEDYIKQAYRKQNEKIGFNIEKEETK